MRILATLLLAALTVGCATEQNRLNQAKQWFGNEYQSASEISWSQAQLTQAKAEVAKEPAYFAEFWQEFLPPVQFAKPSNTDLAFYLLAKDQLEAYFQWAQINPALLLDEEIALAMKFDKTSPIFSQSERELIQAFAWINPRKLDARDKAFLMQVIEFGRTINASVASGH